MVHPLPVVCRSVVWFAVLLVSSDGRVAEFGKFGEFRVAWSFDATLSDRLHYSSFG